MNKKIKVKNNEKKVTFSVGKGDLSGTGTEVVGDTQILVECDKADGTGKEFVDVTAATANTKFFAPATVVKVKFVIKNAKAYAGFDKFECKKADDSAFTTPVTFTAVAEGTTALEKIATFPMPAEDCKVIGSLKKLVAPGAGTITINGKTPFALENTTNENVCDLAKIDASNFDKITQVVIKQGATTLATFAATDIEAKPASGDGDAAKLVQIDFSACTNLATAQNLVIKIKAKPGCWLEKTFTIKVKTS